MFARNRDAFMVAVALGIVRSLRDDPYVFKTGLAQRSPSAWSRNVHSSTELSAFNEPGVDDPSAPSRSPLASRSCLLSPSRRLIDPLDVAGLRRAVSQLPAAGRATLAERPPAEALASGP